MVTTDDGSLSRLQSETLALAVHELKTPLTTIRGSLQLLLRLPSVDGQDPRVRELAEMALAQTKFLGDLVHDLSEAVGMQTELFDLRPQKLDLVTLVAEMVRLAQGANDRQSLLFTTE